MTALKHDCIIDASEESGSKLGLYRHNPEFLDDCPLIIAGNCHILSIFARVSTDVEIELRCIE
jgi:hypothetical protein